MVENEKKSVEEIMSEFEKINNKIKFESFGKTKIRNKKPNKVITNKEGLPEEELAKDLLKKQNEILEKEVATIKEMKNGRNTKVFKLMEKIRGPKKQGQEASAVRDHKTKELVVSPEEIEKVSLEYCKEVLTNNVPDNEYEMEIKIKEKIHEVRMEEKNKSEVTFAHGDFRKVVNKMEKNKKSTYDFLVKSGEKFKKEVFKLCVKFIEGEKFPSSFDRTTLHQIYKGKGLREELSNSRFIHSKEWLPRTCDFMVVEKFKPDIIRETSKFQIGGIEKHRPQEHLFTVKSVLALYKDLDLDIIFQLYDIQKYFDKENLRDAMDTLYRAGVDPKMYRVWFNLNKNTLIRVKTGSGFSEWAEAGELIGQGTGGGALVSSINLDMDMEEFFEGSSDEIAYGGVRLQPLMFQDDVVRLAGNIAKARAGNIKIRSVVKLKQLEMHPDKTGVIVFGDKKKIKSEIEENPIMFNQFETKPKVKDKWLGEIFHEDGLSASVEATINERSGKIKASIREVVAVVEDCRMQIVGGAMAAFDLWEAAVLPALLYNSDTWVEISTKTLETLEELQHYFVRSLLKIPASTPKPSLLSETGLLSMKHRIMAGKLIFANCLKNMEEETLAKQIFEEQVKRGWPGLARESEKFCQELGLPNILKERIDKKKWETMVKKSVLENHQSELKERMEGLKKLEGIVKDNLEIKEYFKFRNLEDTRVMFRLRTRMLELKANQKNNPTFRKEGWKCDGCKQEIENEKHVMECTSYDHVRVGKKLEVDKDLISYFKEVMKIKMRNKK